MTTLHANKHVPYSCEEMYNMISDISSYALFVPYCIKSEVNYRDNDEMQATIEVGVLGMTQSLIMRGFLQTNKIIEMRLVGGPFSRLECFWRFEPLVNGSSISFDLEFKFTNRMLSMLVDLESFMAKAIDAFTKRAQEIYGDRDFVSS